MFRFRDLGHETLLSTLQSPDEKETKIISEIDKIQVGNISSLGKCQDPHVAITQ